MLGDDFGSIISACKADKQSLTYKQMEDIPTPGAGKYSVIMADPPWAFAVRSPKGEGRSASRHYGTMNIDDIKALPVSEWAAKDCALLIWAIDPMLDVALDVIKAWGFTFKTVGYYWAKENRKSPGMFMGTGYYTRANPEQCLLATRGRPQRVSRSVRRLIVSPIREHSRKPDEAFERTERLFTGPYLEMFARQSRPGWDSWGNEATKFDEAA